MPTTRPNEEARPIVLIVDDSQDVHKLLKVRLKNLVAAIALPPSVIAASFAHTTSSATRPRPAEVSDRYARQERLVGIASCARCSRARHR